MISLSHKSKQYLLVALKVLILAATFWYIYSKLEGTDAKTVATFKEAFAIEGRYWYYYVIYFLLLTGLNWFFEILKWKTVVSVIARIPFKKALQQSLAALTISLATPSRIGEYGAKAMYYPSGKRKQILLLNFFSNGVQMLTTVLFGLYGLFFIWMHYNLQLSVVNLVLLLIVMLLLGFLGYLFKEKELIVKGFSVGNVIRYYKNLGASIQLRTFVYASIRYAVFSFLFYSLLHFFGVEMPLWDVLPIIFAMYLLVSIIPSLFIFDVVVRGGVAVWLFSLAGVSELPVLSAVFCMWILNFVLPAIWGSFYVISYKPTS